MTYGMLTELGRAFADASRGRRRAGRRPDRRAGSLLRRHRPVRPRRHAARGAQPRRPRHQLVPRLPEAGRRGRRRPGGGDGRRVHVAVRRPRGRRGRPFRLGLRPPRPRARHRRRHVDPAAPRRPAAGGPAAVRGRDHRRRRSPAHRVRARGRARAPPCSSGPRRWRRASPSARPFAVRETKRLLYAGLGRDFAGHVADNRAVLERCFASADHREGVAAFLERRPPAFTGR